MTTHDRTSGLSTEETRAVMDGRLREALGLSSADLSAGLDLARSHLQRGALQEAFRVYVALILCEPGNVEFQVGLANCALAMGENNLALQAASAAIGLAPRDPRGYLLSGRACLAIGAHAEAAEDLQAAVEFGRAARNATVVEDARNVLQALAGRDGQTPAVA